MVCHLGGHDFFLCLPNIALSWPGRCSSRELQWHMHSPDRLPGLPDWLAHRLTHSCPPVLRSLSTACCTAAGSEAFWSWTC